VVLLVGYLAGVYLLVVVVGGAVLPPLRTVKVTLTFVAAVLVALTLGPLWVALCRRLPLTVEDRLNRLATRHLEWEEVGDGLAQLCRLVTEAFRAVSTEVTVQLGGGVTIRRAFVADGAEEVGLPLPVPAADGRGLVRSALRRGSRDLGELLVLLAEDRHLSPVENRLLNEAADHAALVVEVGRIDRSLQTVVAQARDRHEELQHSRTRIPAVMEAERRRVERNIHDGAQQHLVALAVNLRLLRVLLDRDPARAALRTCAVQEACTAALRMLDELSLGLYPSELLDRGPVAALSTVAASSPVPMMVLAPDPDQRWSSAVERALYFTCIEAVQNALKHGQPGRITVTVSPTADDVTVTVDDDGRGYDVAKQPTGSGTTNMRDRVESVGGTLAVRTAEGGGTSVTARIPMPDAPALSAGLG
jgi:signal transduction histidine kinase